jgi:undecaprenyl-diphosphatase
VLSLFSRWRGAPRLALTLGLAVGMADGISYYGIKPLVGRERPCKQVGDLRIIPGTCSGHDSFPSNHAANGGAITAVLAIATPWPVAIAGGALTLIVGLSRVYLGVHFPTDVLAGFAVGGFLGFVTARLIYRRKPRRKSGNASRKPFTAVENFS